MAKRCASHSVEEINANKCKPDAKEHHKSNIFSSPCQRQSELLPSLGARRPLTFQILIFFSKTT
jgi:hypothetical protein